MARHDLTLLHRWLEEGGEDDDGLGLLREGFQAVALHPDDAVDVTAALKEARGADPVRDETWQRLAVLAAEITDRYRYDYDPSHEALVAAVRGGLDAPRGRGLVGRHGVFRRQDLVTRAFPNPSDPDEPILQDAVFIESEPWSEHARQWGRMVAVFVMDAGHHDRWFVDHLHPGKQFGRPW